MQNRVLLCVTLFAAMPLLPAQEEKAVEAADVAMPNPKTAEHAALAVLAGNWETVMKSEAMPGVPGMEEAMESKGTERAELICDGLWLRSVIDGTYQGQPFQGIWLTGYNPFEKRYTGIWVSSNDEQPGASKWSGAYDKAAKTWTWTGKTQEGEWRSVFAIKSPDETVETNYLTTPDGKEVKCVEVTRKRIKGAVAAEAATTATPDGLAKEHALLLEDVGEWGAVIEMTYAGQTTDKEKCTERNRAMCMGRWLWTDFNGTMMGAPLEGHALVGYDAAQKKYVSFWVDSMSATPVEMSGTFDAASKTFTFAGTSTGPAGDPMTVSQKIVWKDDNTRVMDMEFEAKEGTSNMQITYTRK